MNRETCRCAEYTRLSINFLGRVQVSYLFHLIFVVLVSSDNAEYLIIRHLSIPVRVRLTELYCVHYYDTSSLDEVKAHCLAVASEFNH